MIILTIIILFFILPSASKKQDERYAERKRFERDRQMIREASKQGNRWG